MTVLAYESTPFSPVPIGYDVITGQAEVVLSDNAEIDIGEVMYAEYLTLPPIDPPQWGYVYVWKAQLFQADGNTDDLTTFASLPPRYKIGHLTVATNAGVVWNDVLTFEDQVTPLFRGNFYTDNPNPGDGFPFGTIPLGESVISVWRTSGSFPDVQIWTQSRGTKLNVFLFRPGEYILRINYSMFLSWTTLNILAVAPKPFVVVYP